MQDPTVAADTAPVAIDQDVCSFLPADTVETVLGQRVGLAEGHISATPQALMRDCVYFPNVGGFPALLTLSVRQESTSSEAAEGVVDDLREEYPEGASESQVHLGAGFLGFGQVSGTAFDYCWNADSCFTSIAFGVPPHYFVVNVRRNLGGLQVAQAVANAVLARFGQ